MTLLLAKRSVFDDNSAETGGGGAISLIGVVTAVITESGFVNNIAAKAFGGAVFFEVLPLNALQFVHCMTHVASESLT